MCLTSIVANKTSLQLGLPNEYLGSVAHTAPLLLPFPSFPSFPSNHQRSRSTARSGCASRTASCRWTAWKTAWDSLGFWILPGTIGCPWQINWQINWQILQILQPCALYKAWSLWHSLQVADSRHVCLLKADDKGRWSKGHMFSTFLNFNTQSTFNIFQQTSGRHPGCLYGSSSVLNDGAEATEARFYPHFPYRSLQYPDSKLPWHILTMSCVAVYVEVHMLEIEVAIPVLEDNLLEHLRCHVSNIRLPYIALYE